MNVLCSIIKMRIWPTDIFGKIEQIGRFDFVGLAELSVSDCGRNPEHQQKTYRET
jgi:hypothetical protein